MESDSLSTIEVPTFCNCHRCGRTCRGNKVAYRQSHTPYTNDSDTKPGITLRLAGHEVTREFGPAHPRPVCESCIGKGKSS